MTPVFQSLGNGDPPPNHRLAGETYAQYLERRRAWSAGRSGFGTAGGSAGMSQPAGMPPPIPASAMPGAGQVGNYAVPVTRGLPQPVAVMPVARAPGPFPAQFQVGS